MAGNMTFGEILREARERSGLDLQTAAEKLRLRADIVKAIEDNDFSRMPQSGYTRNMISAYARLVGLNPNEVVNMYLDAQSAHQTSVLRKGSMHSTRRAADRAAASQASGQGRRRGSSAQDPSKSAPLRNGSGRALYEDRTTPYSRARSASGAAGTGVHPSRQSLGQSTQYTNLYAPPANVKAAQSKLPFIIGGAVIVILLIIVLVLLFGNKGSSTPAATTGDSASTVPITGLSDTSNKNASTSTGASSADDSVADPNSTSSASTSTAPTKATFTYKVASGGEAYIEVYEGDSGTASVAKTVSGPAEQSFEVTSTLRFVSDATSSVTATVDGEAVTLEENSNGMYDYTCDFTSILSAWQKEHGAISSSSTATGTSSTASGSTSGTVGDSTKSSGSSSSNSGSTSGSGSGTASSGSNSSGSSSGSTTSGTSSSSGSTSSGTSSSSSN